MDAASTSLDEQLREFRAAHPLRTVEVAQQVWTYADTGGSAPPVVLLPGLSGTASAMFPVIRGLAHSARVVSVGYPPGVKSVASALAGVVAVLESAEIFGPTVVVGHSLGAALAQGLVRMAPQRVRALALANFGLYSPLRGRLLARTLRWLARLPERARTRLVISQIRGLVPAGAGRAFWTRFLSEEVLSQSRIMADQFALLGDLLRQPPFSRTEFATWGGRVLLLESEEDTGFEPAEQSALRALHPRAAVHVFPGAGHLSWVEQTDAFVSEIVPLLAP